MKKMRKIVSVMTAAAVIAGVQSAQVITVGAKSVTDIVRVPLDYFDSDDGWREASGTAASMPVSIAGSIDTTKCEARTRRWGGDGSDPISAAKDEDDSYLWYQTLDTSVAGDTYFELVSYRMTQPFDRVVLEAGDDKVITVSIDVATSNVNASNAREVINTESNASVTANSGNKWSTLASINSSAKLGTADIEANKWYNVVFELGGENAQDYKYYVDGIEAGGGTLPQPNLGLIRAGVKKVAGQVDDMAFDNFSVRVGEPFTMERYYADKTAKALGFNDIKGDNEKKSLIKSDLTLVNMLSDEQNGSTISWETSNSDVISDTGAVTRTEADVPVTLTATVTNGGKTTVKEFDVVVVAMGDVDKTELNTLLAEASKLSDDDYTAESYEDYLLVYNEAVQVAASDSSTTTAVNESVEKLKKAIGALVYAYDESGLTYGVLTKDTFVQKNGAGNPDSATLTAKYPVTEASQGTARRAFLGFDISAIDKNAGKVYLQLYVTQMGANATYSETISVHSVSGSWTEDGLNWINMPKDYSAEAIAVYGPDNIQAGSGKEGYKIFDVTEYVLSQKKAGATEISFAIGGTNSGSGMINIASKEDENGRGAIMVAEPYVTVAGAANEDLNAIELPSEITKATKLTLPSEGAVYNNSISWTTSNADIIAPDGTVTLPQTEEAVTLTAVIAKNGLTFEKSFDISVKRLTPEEEDWAALTFDTIKGENTLQTNVMYNLTLPKEGVNGTPISWASSNESIISNSGAVVRDALADAKDVALTATIGERQKVFNLRVVGEIYVNDDCTDFSHAVSYTPDLKITTESTWRITGIAHSANGKTGQSVVYNASEGAYVQVETVVNNIGSLRVQLLTSADNAEYTPFTAVSEAEEYMPIGEYGGYKKLIYTATAPLPEGTRYLKLVIPDTDKAWRNFVTGVKITAPQEKLTFEDIKADNTDGNCIVGNLVLPDSINGAEVVWSSSSEYISDKGVFTRPDTDTPVTLTAVITDGEKTTTKVYNLIAKAYTDNVTVTDKPFAWYMIGERIAGVKADSGFLDTATLYASCDVVNLTGEQQQTALVLAVYSADGRLMNISYEVKSISSDMSAVQHIESALELTEGADYTKSTVKSFVWDLEQTPIADALSVTRTN